MRRVDLTEKGLSGFGTRRNTPISWVAVLAP